MKQLLNEKYRPRNVGEYTFLNPEHKQLVEKWLFEKSIPNVLLSGVQGTGKSTLAKILLNELGVGESGVDVKVINGSLLSIATIREELTPWLRKRPMGGGLKYVLLEEMDRISAPQQQALRVATEEFSSTTRFIATCNYPEKISAPLHSRFQELRFDSMNTEAIIEFVIHIIEEEGLAIRDEASLMSHIEAHQPDIRKIINSIDQSIADGFVGAAAQPNGMVNLERWEALWASGEAGKVSTTELISLTEGVDDSNYVEFYTAIYNNIQHNVSAEEIPAAVTLCAESLYKAETHAHQRMLLDSLVYQLRGE